MSNIEQKHIVFVQHAGIGGAFISLRQIVESAIKNNAKVTVLLLRKDYVAKSELQKAGADVILTPYLAQLRFVVGGWTNLLSPVHVYFLFTNLLKMSCSAVAFNKLLQQLKPDLVYLNSLCVFLYAKNARKNGIPVILHIREMYKKMAIFTFVNKWHQRLITEYTDRIFSIGKEEVKRLQIENDKIKVIKNYVDLKEWTCIEKKAISEVPVLLYTGGFNIIKGYHILLLALEILDQKQIPFQCIFLGSSEGISNVNKRSLKRCVGKKRYQRMINVFLKLQQSKQIELMPFVTRPMDVFAKADMLIFPSVEPHFPRPVIEAGATGIAVIASDIAGPNDIVEHQKNGILVRENSEEELAEAIIYLIKNPQKANDFGRYGRLKVEKEFGSNLNGNEILSEIAHLMTKHTIDAQINN